MFGWLRRRRATPVHDPALQAANDTALFVANLRAMLGAAVLPPDDAFAVGLIAGHAEASVRTFARGRCTAVMVESAVLAAAEHGLGPPAPTHAQAVAALLRARRQEEFRRAAEMAALIAATRLGHRKAKADPRAARVRQRVAAMPKSFRLAFGETRAEQVATLLIEELLVEPLRGRAGRR